jgi:hypothetical protein
LFDLDPWQNLETYQAKPFPPVFKYIGAQARRLNRQLQARIQSRWPDGIPVIQNQIKPFFHKLTLKIHARWPDGIPFILWIREKYNQVLKKLNRRTTTGSPTPKPTGGTDE